MIVAVLPLAFVTVAVAWTLTPLAVPTKSFSGVKVTAPVVASIEYVPSPSTVTVVSSVG